MPDATWILDKGAHATVLCRSAETPAEEEVGRFGGLPGWRAIKVVHVGPSGRSPHTRPHDIVKEADILRSCQHINVITLLSYEYDPGRWEHRLELPLLSVTVREILDHQHIIGTPNEVARLAAHDVLSGLTYLHDGGVAHRDVKASNILLGFDCHFKLIDFGTAYDFKTNDRARRPTSNGLEPDTIEDSFEKEDRFTCQVGTGPYRAPELLFSPDCYDPAALDLWATGCVLAEFFLPPPDDAIHGLRDGVDDSAPGSPYDTLEGPAPSPMSPGATRRTLFQDTFGEIGLAASIFRLLGTPSKESWPGFENLSDARKIHFEQFEAQDISQVLVISNGPREALRGLLRLDPASRLPASAVLRLDWLASESLPARQDLSRPYLRLAEEKYSMLASPA